MTNSCQRWINVSLQYVKLGWNGLAFIYVAYCWVLFQNYSIVYPLTRRKNYPGFRSSNSEDGEERWLVFYSRSTVQNFLENSEKRSRMFRWLERRKKKKKSKRNGERRGLEGARPAFKPVRLGNGGRYFTLSRPVNATLQKQHKSCKMYLKYQK